MSISKWLKIDLHIHSWISNVTKQNDYEGGKYDVDKLIEKLKTENINIFSITDHNILNKGLYKDLLDSKEKLLKEDMNFIVGVELDIEDSTIYGDKPFHALLFFQSYNIEKIDKIIQDMTKDGKADLNIIFNTMNKYNERDFILIPHFNNKTSGLKNEEMTRSAVDCLNATIFDAYEDTNNIDKVQESLEVYSECGYKDLPMLIFSDCHNIELYPKYKSKSDKNPSFLSVLGSVEYPFNTLKLAFQDSKLRIGLDEIKANKKYRIATNRDNSYNRIDYIKINDYDIKFSEYQNTIIGGFGSGKSFLLNLIIYGRDKLKRIYGGKYKQLLKNIEQFKIIMSDGSSRNSLEELSNHCEIIFFEQNQKLYYSEIIGEEEKCKLEENLRIRFQKLAPIINIGFEDLDCSIKSYKSIRDKPITDSFEYELLKNRKSYRVDKDLDIKFIGKEQDNIDLIINSLTEEREKKIFDQFIYSKEEKVEINNIIEIIKYKNKKWITNVEKHNIILSSLEKNIEEFNKKQSENESNIESNTAIYENIKVHIFEITKSLKKLSQKTKKIEKELTEQKYKENRNKYSKYQYGDFELITKYKCNEDYKSYKGSILKSEYRQDSFFNGIVNTIKNKDDFHMKNEFKKNISDYYKKVFYDNFSEACYDIKKDNRSIMERSAGERANMILELIFSIIEENRELKKNIILLIDQPEDNLDNKNIDKNIVQKIIKMKEKDTLPQLILVTHNANVSISADSENIIIANKNENICNYKNSGIEDEEFIVDVCKILEGGTSALKRRGMKFSISYVKEYLKKDD